MKKNNTTTTLPVVEIEKTTEDNNNATPEVKVALKVDDNKSPILEVVMKDENVKETKKVIDKIVSLHNAVNTYIESYKTAANNAVITAIEIGKLLLDQKQMRNKTFMLWVECYLPFGYETAGRYMRLAKSSHMTTQDKDGKTIKVDEAKSLRAAYIMTGIEKPKPASGSGTGKLKAFILIKQLMELLPSYNDQQKKEVLPYLDNLVQWVTITKQELHIRYDDTIKTTVIDLNKKETTLTE